MRNCWPRSFTGFGRFIRLSPSIAKAPARELKKDVLEGRAAHMQLVEFELVLFDRGQEPRQKRLRVGGGNFPGVSTGLDSLAQPLRERGGTRLGPFDAQFDTARNSEGGDQLVGRTGAQDPIVV